MEKRRYIIITPVRDEAPHIEKTIDAVMSQTVRPTKWIVVDDGSTDGTSEILDSHAARTRWMSVVHRPNRGRRINGGGVMEAFAAGYAAMDTGEWDYLIKLDGDLSFAPDYFQRCLERFDAEPKLGIGGGTVCRLSNGKLQVDSTGDPPFHVRGATKIYRRACWAVVSPLVRDAGWDTLDEVTANFHGWTTRTFAELTLIQQKPTGAADGAWRNAFKNGRANYICGYHPAFMIAKAIRRTLDRPLVLGSLALLSGFAFAYVTRAPREANHEVIRYLRQQQVRRLLHKSSIYA